MVLHSFGHRRNHHGFKTLQTIDKDTILSSHMQIFENNFLIFPHSEKIPTVNHSNTF